MVVQNQNGQRAVASGALRNPAKDPAFEPTFSTVTHLFRRLPVFGRKEKRGG